MLELSLAPSLQELGPSLWSELSGPRSYPFLSYAWLSALEESNCLGMSRGWIPRHLVIRKGKEICAVAPAYIKLHSYGEFVFDQEWAEFSEHRLGQAYYPKLVIGIPFTPTTGPRVLFRSGLSKNEQGEVFDVLTGAMPELAEKLGLSSVHLLFADQFTAAELAARGWAERFGLQYHYQNPGHGSFDEFLSEFSSKKRAKIRRERRELEAREIRIVVKSGSNFEDNDAEIAYRFYLSTVDKHVWGRRYLTKMFFERIVNDMPEALHFVVAKDERGEPLGGAFNLLGESALFGRYWGALRDIPFLHFEVCLYRGIEESITRELSRFEPGAGGGHKRGRGFVPAITRSLHYLREPRLDLAVREFCAREAVLIEEQMSPDSVHR